MKKIISLLALLALTSCSSIKIWDDIEITKTWVKVDDITISTWSVEIWDDIKVSKDWVKVDTIEVSSWETEEKDTVIVIDNDDSDLDWKTQEEVVEEMGDYVNDLFNMIEEDVK